jgi:hypothetical protein
MAGEIVGRKGGVNRWAMDIGSATAETGGNTGSDLTIGRFADDGSYLGLALQITRSTGSVRMPVGKLNLSNVPQSTGAPADLSSKGIVTGDVYNNGGVLCIAP